MGKYDELFGGLADSGQPSGYEPLDPEEYKLLKQEERDHVFGMLDEITLKTGQDVGVFRQYLEVQARHINYTASNALLVLQQEPTAKQLKTAQEWKRQGVWLNKNPKPVYILKPGEQYRRQEDGRIGQYYNPQKVYDISQTRSSRRPPSNLYDLHILLNAVLNTQIPIEVIQREIPDNLGALYHPKNQQIYIQAGIEPEQIFKSCSRELAFAYLDEKGLDRENAGFYAQTVSHLLCRHYGIESNNYQVTSLPEAFRETDPKEIRSAFNLISEPLNQIQRDMENSIQAQTKQKQAKSYTR